MSLGIPGKIVEIWDEPSGAFGDGQTIPAVG